MSVLPVLFISHGAPTLALEDSPTGRFLDTLASRWARPSAIIVVSAHWEAPSVTVNFTPQPSTVHDFGGFPRALYQLRYPVRSDLGLADAVFERLEAAGLSPKRTTDRGLDHGAWVPLLRMYPGADVPVVAVSLPWQASPDTLMALGEALAPLREDGRVLVLASGSLTHNLYALTADGSPTAAWAHDFSSWVAARLEAGDREALRAWQDQAPFARQNHPSAEHFNPLLVACGAARKPLKAHRLHEDWRFGVLSMAAWQLD
ncbi:DODA-type extradiol aromatic ring-opening family dioxygenase [Gulbenkiania mobilis]|uniref:DODA-type extradiol aromatic ring-opening family dioxygenase n=1 Tax=Gulbenkiania mobilis TaxID=397457 RepID=UPI0006BBB778|nr:class III extradiol ring-cleavage dioxygenase [Gulbenkiania mobilis]